MIDLRVTVALLLAASVAGAGPARKTLPDKYTKAAGQLFARAAAADARGERARAIALYAEAFAVVPDASIAFNIAEIAMELGQYEEAVKHYDLYLALAPTARDRAAIAGTIAKVESMPGTIAIASPDGDLVAQGYVLVDGAIVHRPGAGKRVVLTVKRGRHSIDVITPLTIYSDTVDVGLGGHQAVEAAAAPRIDGNVVISMARPNTIRVFANGAIDETTRRVLDPGRRRAAVMDGSRECPPITLDVPRDPDRVAYVHVASTEATFAPRCRKLVVVSHTLVFKP